MKRLAMAWMLLAAGLAIFLGASVCCARQAKTEKSGPEKSGPEKAKSPVPVDAEFTEALDDWKMIEGEIARIEKAEGTVEVPMSVEKLRARAQIKVARLEAWIKAHGVEGWNYDAQLARFEAPSSVQTPNPAPPATGSQPAGAKP